MQILQSDAHVTRLESIFNELAILSEKILKAGSTGNEEEVRHGVDRLRQLRAEVLTIDKKYHQYFDTRPENEKIIVSNLLQKYKKAEAFCTAWSQRYKDIAPYKVLFEIENGINGVLDMHIPDVWNWKEDVVALSNREDTRLIRSLLNRGQKRIMVFCISDIDSIEKIEGVSYLTVESEVEEYFYGLQKNYPSRLCILDFLVSSELELDLKEKISYDTLYLKIQASFKKGVANLNTLRMFGNRWITQGIQNLPTIASQPSLKYLSAQLTGLPLIIISPGPSLDKNIKLLKQIQGQAILLAPAQTIIALKKEGITPDIIIVADPSNILYMFEDFDMTEVHALLIGVSCHPELYKRYKNKIISFSVNSEIDSWILEIFGERQPTGSCGSVASMAFLIGGVLQCDPIILVGQDLSFSGQKQYSEGAADGGVAVEFDETKNTFVYTNMRADLNEIFEEAVGQYYVGGTGATSNLPGYYGGTVKTKTDYAMFHNEFETLAAEYLKKEHPPRLFNCTEGGAFISGFEHIPLQKAISYLKEAKSPLIDKEKLFFHMSDSVDRANRRSQLRNALLGIKRTLHESTCLASDCHSLAQKTSWKKFNIDKLSRKELELAEKIKKSKFIAIAIQDEIKSIEKLGETATDLSQNLEASILLYKLIIRETKKIQLHILNAIHALEITEPD